MAQLTVLVTFYSRGGATEQLATAAAVGAVQGRAAIRLRRVPDIDPAAVVNGFPDAAESLRRMRKQYVAPREADVLAADALIVATPPDVAASAPEWAAYLDLLETLQTDGRLQGKVGAAVGSGPGFESLSAAMDRLGLVAVPSENSAPGGGDAVALAVALGRQVAATAEAVKNSTALQRR